MIIQLKTRLHTEILPTEADTPIVRSDLHFGVAGYLNTFVTEILFWVFLCFLSFFLILIKVNECFFEGVLVEQFPCVSPGFSNLLPPSFSSSLAPSSILIHRKFIYNSIGHKVNYYSLMIPRE